MPPRQLGVAHRKPHQWSCNVNIYCAEAGTNCLDCNHGDLIATESEGGIRVAHKPKLRANRLKQTMPSTCSASRGCVPSSLSDFEDWYAMRFLLRLPSSTTTKPRSQGSTTSLSFLACAATQDQNKEMECNCGSTGYCSLYRKSCSGRGDL